MFGLIESPQQTRRTWSFSGCFSHLTGATSGRSSRSHPLVVPHRLAWLANRTISFFVHSFGTQTWRLRRLTFVTSPSSKFMLRPPRTRSPLSRSSRTRSTRDSPSLAVRPRSGPILRSTRGTSPRWSGGRSPDGSPADPLPDAGVDCLVEQRVDLLADELRDGLRNQVLGRADLLGRAVGVESATGLEALAQFLLLLGGPLLERGGPRGASDGGVGHRLPVVGEDVAVGCPVEDAVGGVDPESGAGGEADHVLSLHEAVGVVLGLHHVPPPDRENLLCGKRLSLHVRSPLLI